VGTYKSGLGGPDPAIEGIRSILRPGWPGLAWRDDSPEVRVSENRGFWPEARNRNASNSFDTRFCHFLTDVLGGNENSTFSGVLALLARCTGLGPILS